MTFYKDFHKEVKDQLTKSFQPAGEWKLECKFKGPKDDIFVNPQATQKFVAVDFEYCSTKFPVKSKTNFNSNNMVKETVTYEEKGHKVEVAVEHDFKKYEATYDGTVSIMSVNTKVTPDFAEVGVAAKCATNCSVGGGIKYGFNSKAMDWTAGVRYAAKGYVLDIATAALKNYTTGAMVPFEFAGHKVNFGFEVACAKKQFAGVGSAETNCIIFPNNTARVRVDNKMNWAALYIMKFADNWKAAFTLDANLKVGVSLTHE